MRVEVGSACVAQAPAIPDHDSGTMTIEGLVAWPSLHFTPCLASAARNKMRWIGDAGELATPDPHRATTTRKRSVPFGNISVTDPDGPAHILGDVLRHSAEEIQVMVMPATVPEITTIEELLALPDDGQRHELLEGVHVVTPAPRYVHQRALAQLQTRLQDVLAGRADAETLWSPADIVLGPKTLVQPDLFVIRRTPGARPERWADVGVPLIAIEILSPTTAACDRGAKRWIYQRAGVSEYWIVDLDARLIERWRPEDERPEILDRVLRWSLTDGSTAELDVARYFAAVWEG